jgi:GAF domain-containing protein
MRTSSSLDRESFQQLLASAFAVQESQMDGQFLSAIMEVQRLVTRGELGVDGALLLIVESARDVANAAGVAIGLLEGEQLIYRAGSGCSARHIGSRVTASLTVSSNTKTSREILRVENAQTDTRIEAAICRQFGAQSLLILPIYHDRVLAGVLEVLFSEAHAFRDREVRTYRLMAGLIEAVALQATQLERKENQRDELPAIAHAFEQGALQKEEFLDGDGSMLEKSKQAIYQRCGAALAAVRELAVLRQPGLLATRIVRRAKEVTWHKPPLNVTLAAVATVLMLTFWIAAGGGRGPASPLGHSALPGSTATEQQERFEPAKAIPAEGTSRTSNFQPAPVSRSEPRIKRTGVRRARKSKNEVDYLGDDVTVRHFTYKPAPAPQRRGAGGSRVAYIGEDVTVRYFTPESPIRSDSRRISPSKKSTPSM